MLEKRTALLSEIQGRYAVSDAEAERYALEPHKVLPELAAKVMLDSFDASVSILASMLPQMVEQIVSQRNVASEAQKAFYDQWPQLARPEYAPEIQRITAMYRSMNPKAPLKKALSDIGALAMTTLGIPLAPVSAPAPPAPAMRPVPFVPGGAGTVPSAPPSSQDVNIFAHLATMGDED
jgi:hypothetical protein